jgi:type IV pilus assembly protein PilA
MIAVAIIGLLSAVAIPAFVRYIRRSKTTEATMNVRKLYDALISYHASEHADPQGNILLRVFPISQGPTPGIDVCCGMPGQKCAPNPNYWETPTWAALSFSIDDPFYYWYQTVQLGLGTAPGDQYYLEAYGNLDCDAFTSLYRRSVTVLSDYSDSGGSGLYTVNAGD